MGDEAAKPTTRGRTIEYKFTSIKSPDYRREFINGALSNITPRGEIVCDFHFESRDMPTEQIAKLVSEATGQAALDPLEDPGTYTREVKFSIIINVPFAKDLVILLSDKIKEIENRTEKKSRQGGKK